MADKNKVDIYVRFCDTDAAGHVNNTSYFVYFEEARTKFMQALGIGNIPVTEKINFILASTKCDYRHQAFAYQTLVGITNVSKVGNKSFTLEHILENKDGKTVAQGDAVMVCFNYEKQVTVAIPEQLRQLLLAQMNQDTTQLTKS